jgi:hypothetical protein
MKARAPHSTGDSSTGNQEVTYIQRCGLPALVDRRLLAVSAHSARGEEYFGCATSAGVAMACGAIKDGQGAAHDGAAGGVPLGVAASLSDDGAALRRQKRSRSHSLAGAFGVRGPRRRGRDGAAGVANGVSLATSLLQSEKLYGATLVGTASRGANAGR